MAVIGGGVCIDFFFIEFFFCKWKQGIDRRMKSVQLLIVFSAIGRLMQNKRKNLAYMLWNLDFMWQDNTQLYIYLSLTNVSFIYLFYLV